jgi:hypothetical protein
MFFFSLFITADGKKLLQGQGIGGVATGEFFSLMELGGTTGISLAYKANLF